LGCKVDVAEVASTASVMMSTLVFLAGGLTTAIDGTSCLEFFLFSFSTGWKPKSIDRPTQVGLPTATMDDGDGDGRGGDTMGVVISVELMLSEVKSTCVGLFDVIVRFVAGKVGKAAVSSSSLGVRIRSHSNDQVAGAGHEKQAGRGYSWGYCVSRMNQRAYYSLGSF
jgi:hypothetical protein